MSLSVKERIAAKRGVLAANRSKGLRPYKWKGGKTSFRILPAKDPQADWDRRFGISYLKSLDKQQFLAIGDREVTYGERDVVRELIFDAMRAAPDEAIKDHYKDMLASPRVLFNALILDDKDQAPAEPVLIEMSETAFDSILAQFDAWTEEDPEYDLAGLSTGHVFTCEKTGSGMDTRYTFLATPKKAPLKPAILDKIIDMDSWITSQFEAKEAKAIEFIARVNGAVGIPTTVSAGALTDQSGGAASKPATQTNVNAAAVTAVLEDDDLEAAVTAVEDAVFEEVETATVEDDSPFETVVEETPAEKPTATKPAAKVEAAAPVAQAESEDIDAILAGLD